MGEYELYHHGVKGQKWGIRRTAAQLGHRVAKAGKAAGKTVAKAGKATGKFAGKQASKAGKAVVATVKEKHAENKEKRYYKKLHKKKLSQMTDKEIGDLTKRVQQEANLKDAKYESRVQNARKFYNNVAKQPVNDIISKYAQAAIQDAFKDTSKQNTSNEATQGKDVENTTIQGKKPPSLRDRIRNRNTSGKTNSGGDIEFEVVSEPKKKKDNPVIIRHETTPQPAAADSKAFDDYFESEVRKEAARRKKR